MGKVVRGDLGWSRTAQRPVTAAILHFLPATIELALWSVAPIILIGVWLGILSALHHNRPVDHLLRLFSTVGWSFPTFVFGLMLLAIFYAQLSWLPAGRLSDWAGQEVLDPDFAQFTRLHTVDALLNLRPDIFRDALRHLVLPILTLSYLSWALLLRVTRSAMLEAFNQDYVRTARSKGLKERSVIYTHVMRNALIPVATVGGLLIIGLLNGVVITEVVFDYKGIGWFFATAALQLDIISVLGLTLFSGVLAVLGNLVVDISYAVLDPRVRLG
jgi:peptide/nickel transport system permease protein